jgi:hypothetical protein
MKSYAIILVGVGLAAHVVHRRLDKIELPVPPTLKATLPSEEALGLLSLGYKSLAADYYWLRAIYEFGDPRLARAKYPNLVALTERVLALDPYYVTAYYFAGTALTVEELDPRTSIDMLARGMRYRPDAWQVPFLLGFNLYYFEHDYAGAAQALAHAATLKGAPAITGPLATRLAAQAGKPEIGLSLIDSMLEQITDKKLRELYAERRRLLQLELELGWLETAIERFVATAGRRPKDLEELEEVGLVKTLPDDPLGGRYYVDDEGHAATTSEGQRLRLSPRVTGAKP